MAKRKFFVQLWDCPTCGEKGLNALQYKECPKCGQVLSDDFLKDLNYREQIEIDENDLQYEQAAAGPDWLCPVCGRRNSARYQICQCGSARADVNAPEGAVDSGGKTTGGIKDWMQDDSQLEAKKQKAAKAGKQASFRKKAIIAGSIAAALALFLFVGLYRTQTDVKVTGHAWTRSADIQTYKEVAKTGWEDELPAAGRILSRSREIFNYNHVKTGEKTELVNETRQVEDGYETITKTKRVIDHYETRTRLEKRGNGVVEEVEYREPVYKTEEYTEQVPRYRTVTEQVPRTVPVYEDIPVYKYKCRYLVNEWTTDTTLTEKGYGLNPRWPGTDLQEDIKAPRLGDQRLTNKKEEYLVFFIDEKAKEHKNQYPESVWRYFEEGKTYKALQDLAGEIEVQADFLKN